MEGNYDLLKVATKISSKLNLQPSQFLESSHTEAQILDDCYTQIKQDEAQLYFCIADYIITKLSSYEDDSARDSAWNSANKMRQQLTGEKSENSSSGDQELTTEQCLQFMELKVKTGITFLEYVNQYITQ